jgi:hypothetical protein
MKILLNKELTIIAAFILVLIWWALALTFSILYNFDCSPTYLKSGISNKSVMYYIFNFIAISVILTGTLIFIIDILLNIK